MRSVAPDVEHPGNTLVARIPKRGDNHDSLLAQDRLQLLRSHIVPVDYIPGTCIMVILDVPSEIPGLLVTRYGGNKAGHPGRAGPWRSIDQYNLSLPEQVDGTQFIGQLRDPIIYVFRNRIQHLPFIARSGNVTQRS